MKRNKFTCIIYAIIQWTWGIIQNICGAIVFLIFRINQPDSTVSYYHGAIVLTCRTTFGSMGLGMFIFLNPGFCIDPDAVRVHEWGHTVQSVILGPLYLLVIGLPSLIFSQTEFGRNILFKKKINYTSVYCEKWASMIGEKLTGERAV